MCVRRKNAQCGIAPQCRVGELDKVRMIRARRTGWETNLLLLLLLLHLSPPRALCRLVIHPDNITAMKRSTHSLGARAPPGTSGQKLPRILSISYGGKFLSGADVCTHVSFRHFFLPFLFIIFNIYSFSLLLLLYLRLLWFICLFLMLRNASPPCLAPLLLFVCLCLCFNNTCWRIWRDVRA